MTKQQGKVPPPPRNNRRNLQASPPSAVVTPDNLSKPSEGLVDLNFKVSPSFKRKFKLTSVTRGMMMKELMEASFEAYIEKYGIDHKE
jgi:hypothetical protein